MKYIILPPRNVNRFGVIIAILLSFLMVNACNTNEKESSPSPKDDPNTLSFRSPVEELADSIFNNVHFQSILENQVWVNARVEEFMESAGPKAGAAAGEAILAWAGDEYEFTTQDVELVKEVLGFPDDESFQVFAEEMTSQQEALLNAFSTPLSSLDEDELEELFGALCNSLPEAGSEGRPALEVESTTIEFRRADCCCLRPNECSTNVCNQLSSCLTSAGQFYFSTVLGATGTGAAIGSSFVGVGGAVGAAFGFSASAVFGAVYYGYSVNNCNRAADQACSYCSC